jgi:GxxExxY protein
MAKECDSTLVHGVLRAATQVHRTLGPGLLESIYERALSLELSGNGIGVKSQVPVSVLYRGTDLGLGFRLDLLVADCLIVEVKCVTRLDHSHVKQLLTYLRLTDIETGFLSTSITRRSRPD